MCFLSQVREVFSCYVLKHVLCHFLSFPSGILDFNFSLLDVVPEVS